MYNDYFVVITETHFGVFESITPYTLPNNFPNILSYITKVSGSDLKNFLVDNIGVNLLINKKFQIPFSIGCLYSRKPT